MEFVCGRAHETPAKSSPTRSIVFADGYMLRRKNSTWRHGSKKQKALTLSFCARVGFYNQLMSVAMAGRPRRLTFDILGFDIKMKERAQETIFFVPSRL